MRIAQRKRAIPHYMMKSITCATRYRPTHIYDVRCSELSLRTSVTTSHVTCFCYVGGFSAFYARYPQLCGDSRRPDATTMTEMGDDVMAGARSVSARPQSGTEELVTPSDNVLVGHINDQVTTVTWGY